MSLRRGVAYKAEWGTGDIGYTPILNYQLIHFIFLKLI